MWRRNLLIGLLVLGAGLVVRVALVRTASPDLSPVDLHRFEEIYGLDLPEWYGNSPFFLLWSRGDGQAFVALASDLDLNGPARELAVPAYRFSRVGYAWLGRLAALGRTAWVPVGLMLVNAAALITVGMISSAFARRWGPSHYLLAANPAIFVGFAADTAEPLGVALLMVALVASTGGGASFAAGLLGAVRPSLATALPLRRRNLPALFVTFVVMVLALRFVGIAAFGSGPIPPSTIVIPFAGYLEVWRLLPAGSSLITGIPLIAAVATIYVGLTKKTGGVRVSWAATGMLVLMFGPFVLEHPVNWIRAAAALPVLWSMPPRRGGGVVALQDSANS